MLLKFLLPVVCLIVQSDLSFAQVKVLHFTATSGFDHQTRAASYIMLQQLGGQYNFIIDNDSTALAFNSVANLNQYDAIIFANTSGDAILDANQRSNFEQYIAGGGNLIGIHAATDTYRHSTANGNNTGAWDFYPELMGASVQQNPSHVNGTPFFTMQSQQSHFLLSDIPFSWQKAEEYYYWQYGYFDSLNNSILLMVDSTIGPNGMINSYDAPSATTWYKITPTGNHVFYTSLGHDVTNYTTDTLFIKMMRNALLWATGISSTVNILDEKDNVEIYPNPFSGKINVKLNSTQLLENYRLQIYNAMQQQLYSSNYVTGPKCSIDTESLANGVYMLKITGKDFSTTKWLIKTGP